MVLGSVVWKSNGKSMRVFGVFNSVDIALDEICLYANQHFLSDFIVSIVPCNEVLNDEND